MPLDSFSDYGTALPSSTNPSLSSRAATHIPTRRLWKQFLDVSAFSLPSSYAESTSRLRRNAAYFRTNYALIILIILFCSLVYHPFSMIVFLLIFALWMFFVFFRDDPVVVLGRRVSDWGVIGVLGLVTVLGLVATGLGSLVFVALVIGVVVVGVHGVFRGVEDLFLDENEAAEGGLLSVVR